MLGHGKVTENNIRIKNPEGKKKDFPTTIMAALTERQVISSGR